MIDKINVAELLLHCPKGMELDCTMYDNCTFERIEDVGYIDILVKTPSGIIRLTKEGCYIRHDDYAKCVIFPKGKTTWEGFVPPCKFKNGDVISNTLFNSVCIFRGEGKIKGTVDFYCGINTNSTVYNELFIKDCKDPLERFGDIIQYNFATEEEKAKLFQAIKNNGYNWNEETKTLEKVIESKEDTDNVAVMSGIYFNREDYADEVELHLNNYEIEIRNGKTYAIYKNQETKTLPKLNGPKFKVGDRIRRKNGNEEFIIISINDCTYYYRLNGHCTGSLGIQLQDEYELVPNKFDINTLVAFESRVLIRDTKSQKWSPAIWGFYDSDHQDYQYKLVGCIARYCIPYEGNEHLLGTTDDCDEYFKTWK